MSSAPLPAPVAPALSHSDSLLPTQEGACLARAAPLLSVRALALGKEAPYLVAPRPPPRQHLPRGLAFVKLQVRICVRFLPRSSLYCLKHLQQTRITKFKVMANDNE